MQRLNISIMCLFFVTSAGWAATSDVQVATINARKILSGSKVAKEALVKFQADFSGREQELQSLSKTLREKSTDLEKDGPGLAPSQLMARQKELEDLSREFKRKQQQFVEDRDARKRDDIQHVFSIATQAARSFSEGAHIDMVLQDTVYANAKTDVTEKVIEIMDAQSAR